MIENFTEQEVNDWCKVNGQNIGNFWFPNRQKKMSMSEETTAHNLHLTLSDAMEILGAVKHLKHLLTRAQDFENAAVMRDMEKEYIHLTVKRK